MTKRRKVARCVLDGGAYQLAFHLGQSLERAIIVRATRFAVRGAEASAEVLVTADHVRRTLDESLFDEACSQTGIVVDDKTKNRRSRSPAA